MNGWRGCRVDWLVLALWMDSVVVENWNHSQRQRQRETLGRSWNEENRCTANRGRGRDIEVSLAVDIKCIYTQACFFSSLSKFLQFPSTPSFYDCLKWTHIHSEGHQDSCTLSHTCTHIHACMWLKYMIIELSSYSTLRSFIFTRNRLDQQLLFWLLFWLITVFWMWNTWIGLAIEMNSDLINSTCNIVK